MAAYGNNVTGLTTTESVRDETESVEPIWKMSDSLFWSEMHLYQRQKLSSIWNFVKGHRLKYPGIKSYHTVKMYFLPNSGDILFEGPFIHAPHIE